MLGIVVPGSSPYHPRIKRLGYGEGALHLPGQESGVVVGDKLVKHPFGHVAVHVVQAPRIGFLLSDLGVAVFAVVEIPGVVFQVIRIVAERIGGRGPGPAGVLPFCFSGEPIVTTGVGTEPLAIHLGRVLGHADGRVTVAAHAEGHVGVSGGGASDGVDQLFPIRDFLALSLSLGLSSNHIELGGPGLVFIPGHLVLTHPEGLDFNLGLGPFVIIAVRFVFGATHEKLSAGNRQHVESDVHAFDHLGVGLHAAFVLGIGVGNRVVGARLTQGKPFNRLHFVRIESLALGSWVSGKGRGTGEYPDHQAENQNRLRPSQNAIAKYAGHGKNSPTK